MKVDTVFGHFLREKAHLLEKINQFTNIRKNAQIKLNHIVLSVLLMPFYSITSLLDLDRLSRKQAFKKLFGCTRKMVASDSTVNQALRSLDASEVEGTVNQFPALDLTRKHIQDPACPRSTVQKSRDYGWLTNGPAPCGGFRSLWKSRLYADGQQFPQSRQTPHCCER